MRPPLPYAGPRPRRQGVAWLILILLIEAWIGLLMGSTEKARPGGADRAPAKAGISHTKMMED